jgi:bifunctional non-homologous end joining protein LigD
MLATLVKRPFDRAGWIFELKWDGYRTIAVVDKGNVRLYSRNGVPFSERFQSVATALATIPHRAVLDGEVVVLDEKGFPRFEALQNYWNHRSRGHLVYQVFDVLHLDGHDLCGLPLIRRKQILRQIISDVPGLVFCDHIEERGLAFFDAVVKARLEGMIAKDGTSKYLPGRRSDCWLKVKAYLQQEAVIAGFARSRGSRRHFEGLVIGVYEDGELVHIGEVGTGFDNRTLASVFAQLAPLVQSECPFRKKPKTKAPATWVKAKLVCEVRFTAWTGGHLRHPIFLGMREDKPARTVHRETAVKWQGMKAQMHATSGLT